MARSRIWRNLFDVRKGEYARTLFMSAYLLFVMVAYYILKPVSAAMFLNKFNIDKLPYLYILIAGGGGVLAYFYTRVALKSSLQVAVSWTMMIAVVCLVVLWWLIGLNLAWMLYVFNVWVSLFSIVLISQGWLVAANVFDSREAKRLYGLLGLGAVIGAGVGSAVTRFTARLVGTRNLILACAVMVILAYLAFLGAIKERGVSIAGARAVESEKVEFSARDIFAAVARYRHLQVIIGILLLTFIVDELVDFPFQAMAKRTYRGDQLTAFFGGFNVYLNLVSLVLQLFFTAWVVERIGVGGTIQIMPVSITVASLASALMPGLATAVIARFSEAMNRYTFNRTGMELLYLPLPADLKNRTKAFVDIFIDRFGRGIAGILLAVMLALGLRDLRVVALLTVVFTSAWIVLSWRAQREYAGTVRSRIERRRLELEDARVTVRDPATIRLLEQTAESASARQACYALAMLAEVPGYDLAPLLDRLVAGSSAEVRAKVYKVARTAGITELLAKALSMIHAIEEVADPQQAPVVKAAVTYVLAVSPEAPHRARELLNHASSIVVEGALEALGERRDLAREVLTREWIRAAIEDADPERRRLAASGIALAGEGMDDALARLLGDREPRVVAAACRTAGALGHRASLERLMGRLDDSVLRGVAIESLAAFGPRICGMLGDCLADRSLTLGIRRQIPRVLKLIGGQRSVDALLKAIPQQELSIRGAVLKALSSVRQVAPRLDYGETFVTEQILNEARHYFELYSAIEPLRDHRDSRTAAGLLARSLEERLQQTIERLFRLLGLRYPPEDMHAAYLAVCHRRRREQFLAALDFLDSVLERSLKRVLLPLLDSSERLAEQGRNLFGVEVRDAEAAIRDLIRSGDPWLAACAMAAAAERKLHRLAADILAVGEQSGAEVLQVARAAAQILALGTPAD
jgi:ATP:ADP antiporter, AAA family